VNETLQKRIAGILTSPRAEWAAVATEPADVASLFKNYILILAAVPALGRFLASARFSIAAAISAGVLTYLVTLCGTMVAALVIEKLAPKFQSSGSTGQALKLVAYASTPAWLAGVLYAVWLLSPLVLLAVLYSIYLFYLGLNPVMKTPPEMTVPFMVVAAIAILAVNIVLVFVLQLFSVPYYGF
jgi:hypothetical protein